MVLLHKEDTPPSSSDMHNPPEQGPDNLLENTSVSDIGPVSVSVSVPVLVLVLVSDIGPVSVLVSEPASETMKREVYSWVQPELGKRLIGQREQLKFLHS